MNQKEKIVNLRKKIEFIFQLIQNSKNISASTKEILFYIFSELADNIEQHSRAKHFVLEFDIDSEKIKIKVNDDGIGIPKLFQQKFPRDKSTNLEKIIKAIEGVSTKGAERGYGLRTIKKIVHKMRGDFVVVSEGFGYFFHDDKEEKIIKNQIKGTQILISLPESATIKKDSFYAILEGG